VRNRVKWIAQEIQTIAYAVGMAPEPDASKALTKNPLGPTGKEVAKNIERLRTAKGWTFAALSARLSDIGRDIPPLGLRKIVGETRRVDADDLVALAVALGVSPVTLLMPDSPALSADPPSATGRAERQRAVSVTALSDLCERLDAPVDAEYVWEWLRAEKRLPGMSDYEFISRAWPQWRQQQASVLEKDV
jgi:transcriptional regulator with XRE-family HTH domain